MHDQDLIIDNLIEPRRVPALSGFVWLRDAFALYRGAPLAWLGCSLIVMVLLSLSIIPVIGLAAYALAPGVLAAYVLMGLRQQESGQKPQIAQLFSLVFQGRFLRLGLLTTLFTLLLSQLLLAVLVSDVQLEQLNRMFAEFGTAPLATSPEQSEQALKQLAAFMPFVLASFALMIVNWLVCCTFAAPLMACQQLRAVESIRLGFSALWCNLPALVLLVLCQFVVLLLASMLWLFGVILVTPLLLLCNTAIFARVFPHKPHGVLA
ncbi:hypothetical protein [Chitinilyticum piscinae]|uniref:DUF2189 domain-containing protein n=1 Tax=Chitinilyticum piscinae TaxID=2866724 RepID=A0A8J7FIV0_9NEIS|nr:hypothetical protein [Chitinilyticum piscinae]MBE9608247.1 hypothetical protein [Chitinilyticum piscinae]